MRSQTCSSFGHAPVCRVKKYETPPLDFRIWPLRIRLILEGCPNNFRPIPAPNFEISSQHPIFLTRRPVAVKLFTTMQNTTSNSNQIPNLNLLGDQTRLTHLPPLLPVQLRPFLFTIDRVFSSPCLGPCKKRLSLNSRESSAPSALSVIFAHAHAYNRQSCRRQVLARVWSLFKERCRGRTVGRKGSLET